MAQVRNFTESEKQLIDSMYNAGCHTLSIVARLKCGNRTLKRYLKENGYKRKITKIKWTTESFKSLIYEANPNIEILSEYVNSSTKIHCRCKIDGYEWYALPCNLLKGNGCPVCGNEIVVRGLNDIWTTDP